MNQYFRMPLANGDNNIWSTYLLAQIKSNTGEYSSYLYDDAGVLKISPGRIGINDGTTQGTAVIDTATTIDIIGTNDRWYKIEMTVVGTAVAFASTVLADATSSILPATLTGSYVTTKQGFYHVATARLIGVIWKSASGLRGIINCQNMINGYRGKVYLDSAKTKTLYYDWNYDTYRRWVEYNLATTWNMDGAGGYAITHLLSTEWTKIRKYTAIIINNAGGSLDTITRFTDGADPALLNGGCQGCDSVEISIARRTGGMFDAAGWNAATVKVTVELTM